MDCETEGTGGIYFAGAVNAQVPSVLAIFFNVRKDVIESEPVIWWNTFVNEEDEFTVHHFPVVLDKNGEVYQVFGGNSLCVNYLGVVQAHRVNRNEINDHTSTLYYEFEGPIGRAIRATETMHEIGLAKEEGGGCSEVEIGEGGELRGRVLRFVGRSGGWG